MKIAKNLPYTFFLAIVISAVIFGLDAFISNRVGSNLKEILSGVIAAVLALPLFILGLAKASKVKSSIWVILNSFAIIVILGWTTWISWILYAFKDFHF
jgi:chromate transport protein ChrA